MLDFYLIADDQAHSNHPEKAGLVLAGSLESDVFDRLKRIQLIDGRFEYYTDFRWSRTIILQLLTTIKKRQIESSTDVQKLVRLLDLADQNNSGLLACAD
jgi:hypothetical protein